MIVMWLRIALDKKIQAFSSTKKTPLHLYLLRSLRYESGDKQLNEKNSNGAKPGKAHSAGLWLYASERTWNREPRINGSTY
ncbi:hypothetical protein UPYG_G00298490 [Umbra pygmaea]|uniref:Uncharacterized protein n=1 Tax=Umbra pygmaea TaxID=75934 RepID=A0ABD0W6H8_UMBPY